VGGTNAHVVLEEAPVVATADIQAGPQVLLLSARTAESLEESRSALAAAFSGQDELRLPDVAYTLARRRKENIRMAAVVNDQQHAAAVLGAAEDDNVYVGESVHTDESSSQRIVFLFPGQGAQHVGMARGLYESEPVFAEHFDQCAAGFGEELGIDLARGGIRRDRTKPGAHRPDPTGRCSPWNMRWRS
jgi:phthiocerol/phenolphthiocerol synthesis type-I polyketide synthase E